MAKQKAAMKAKNTDNENRKSGCCIRIPQSMLMDRDAVSVLSALTQQLLMQDNDLSDIGEVTWPDQAAVGELLQQRVRASIEQLTEAMLGLCDEVETLVRWLHSVAGVPENPKGNTRKKQSKPKSCGKRRDGAGPARDAKGRFVRK